MDPRKLAFLQAVIGPDGARALAKAARTPDLEWAIFPRVVMSWVEVASEGLYDADLPGVEGTHLCLAKTEAGFRGSIEFGEQSYAFDGASLFHVAGSVAVALGGDHAAPPPLQHPALPKLGQSIDLLVRARQLRKAQHHGAAKGAAGPGQAAAPQAPLAPIPPIAAAPKPVGPAAGTKVGGAGQKASTSPEGVAKPAGLKVAAPKATLPKLPKLPKRAVVKMKVSKAEAARPCPTCAGAQFRDGQYTACLCFKDLAKSCKTTQIAEGFLLEFGGAWDHEAITTLAENLGK